MKYVLFTDLDLILTDIEILSCQDYLQKLPMAPANLDTVQKYFVMKIFFKTNQVVQDVVP